MAWFSFSFVLGPDLVMLRGLLLVVLRRLILLSVGEVSLCFWLLCIILQSVWECKNLFYTVFFFK